MAYRLSTYTARCVCNFQHRHFLSQRRHITKRISGDFGICFDIDGVLARGANAIPAAVEAIDMIHDKGKFTVPVAFVTNSCSLDVQRADYLSNLFNIYVSPSQMVQAPAPLRLLTEYHHKHCLILGQGNFSDIVREIGFTDFCTIEDIQRHYPQLDVADFAKIRARRINPLPPSSGPPMRKIDMILCLKEPINWETSLQMATDVLTTGGDLSQMVSDCPQIPVLISNLDLQYMEKSHIPRFGNGAFIQCLEALYLRLTGKELIISAASGKPNEMTFQYGEHVLQREAVKLGLSPPRRMYMIGDNPAADIVGANLYQKYKIARQEKNHEYISSIPSCRYIDAAHRGALSEETVESVCSILVNTGVSHENQKNTGLSKPDQQFNDVCGAIKFILERENGTNYLI